MELENDLTKYDSSSCSENEDEYKYEKNNDSAGIGGQLYETKLICLTLLRALKDKSSEFYLGSNLDKIGAIDDIIIRINYTNTKMKPTVLFIQAKHKDKVTTIKERDKINELSITKYKNIFGLQKYLKSYFLILSKFNCDNEDPVFRASFEDLDSHFIIYTCHQENFHSKNTKEVTENPFLKTSGSGKAIKLNNIFYENGVDLITILLQSYRYSRAECVAETFLTCIKNNNINMMNDNLISAYHVYLTENIIEVSDIQACGNRIFKFRDSFFRSNEYFVKIMRDVMLKKVTEDHSLSYPERIVLLKSLPNKLPKQFGNFDLYITGNKEAEIKHIAQILISLINSADRNTHIVDVNDSNICWGNTIQPADMKAQRIGGLVGNLLIQDYNTNMLKINTRNLPQTAYAILKELKRIKGTTFNFFKYRFDINVRCFPKFSLMHRLHDEQFVKTFLNKFTLYCNQAQDTDLNRLIKYELKDLYTGNDEYFRLKLDILFQNFHHRIQKWWRLRNFMSYYTKAKTNKLLEKCKISVIESPVLSLLNNLYRNFLRKYSIKFNRNAGESLKFINFTENYFISTKSTSMTSIKLLQYLTENCNQSYLFLDLNYIITEDYYDCVLKDITLNLDILVCVIKKCVNDEQIQKIKILLEKFKGKLILLIKRNTNANADFKTFDKYIHYEDDRNNINDLETCHEILHKKSINLQGEQISLDILLGMKTDSVNTFILKKILNNETISIGKRIICKTYLPIDHCYQKPEVNCCITLDPTKDLKKFNIIDGTTDKNINEFDTEKDFLIFVTSKEESNRDTYKQYKNCNVHIFIKQENSSIWEKSYGKLNKLFNIVERLKPKHDLTIINNLKNSNKRTMIVAAEPGMGKSTFLEYITIVTKASYQNELILNIVLYEHRDYFEMWENSDINLEKVMIFLFHVFSTHWQRQSKVQADNPKLNSHSDLKLNLNADNAFLEFRNEYSANEFEQFELMIFNQQYNEGKLSVLLDGSDEICPTQLEEFVSLITVLNSSKISHLWITTRNYNNVLQRLEETLCLFSHTLYEWSDSVQLNFLKQYFSKSFEIDTGDLWKNRVFEEYIQLFQNEISYKIMDNLRNNKFTSIPLHISMIVKIYENILKNDFEKVIEKSTKGNIKNIVDSLDLTNLYKKFVELKFHDSYCIKRPWVDLKDSRMLKSMSRDLEEFIEMHKKSAASVLFSASPIIFFTQDDELKMKNFLKEVETSDEKNGIVDEVVNGKPKFVHFSFAEYFAANFLCDKLKSEHCAEPILKFVIDVVMIEKEFEVVRSFIDSNLSNDTTLANCYVHHRDKISELLLLQSQEFTWDNVLTVVIEKPLKNIISFILRATKNNIYTLMKITTCKPNNRSCFLCRAAETKCIDVIEMVHNFVLEHDGNNLIRLFDCGDSPNNPFIITLYNCKEDFEYTKTFEKLLLHLDDDEIFKLFMKPYPPINSICALLTMDSEMVAFVMKYLKKFSKIQREEFFKSEDVIGRNIAFYAVKHRRFDFFVIMKDLLDDKQSIHIFSNRDSTGRTAHDYWEEELRSNSH